MPHDSHDPLAPIERILLGPGPSLIAPRVMRAMATPVLGHLDPVLMKLTDDVRDRLTRLFRAPDGTLALGISGTGSSGMEAIVANLVADGTRVLVIVTGYFGDRLADVCTRYGAKVTRLDVEWGRAVDPEAVRAILRTTPVDIVACTHAETSTGVLNPIREIAAIAHEHDAIVMVDAVTSVGGHPLDAAAWGLDAVFTCSQKCIGAPPGMAPIAFTPAARARRVPCRSVYFDLGWLEDYWVRRKYHHTMSSTMIYALREALVAIDEEGLEARWARHERHHRAFVLGLEAMGIELLPPPGERLWTVHVMRIPAGIDDARVRQHLLEAYRIEIGSGLGPFAGKAWRVGLMGASSTRALLLMFLSALDDALHLQGYRGERGAGVAAATEALDLVTASA